MSGSEIFFLVFAVLGGLALFILGMKIMSESLHAATGQSLRKILGVATRNRFGGVALGTLIGFLIQSSASTVMIVGFINAGLMTLAQSVPPMLGANIGTTLSMQLISFRLSDYCFVAIALGFLVSVAAPGNTLRSAGRALMGFGILFLGMNTMSEAFQPHREMFRPWLAFVDGSTPVGMLVGVLVSALITGVIQSSGATIGMGFALISAGVVTDLQGIFPIIVGANIGTCVTALLGSIGTNVDARRSAFSHLFFNIFSAVFAMLAAPLFYKYIPATSADLVHQAANANTAKMLLTALIVMPFAPAYARIVRWLTPSKRQPEQSSYLDHDLLKRPEMAIYAALRELQRVGEICNESFELNSEYMLKHEHSILRRIRVNEESVNEIKKAMKEYVAAITSKYISKRQAILLQHVDRCMSDIERIGDHVEKLGEITRRRQNIPHARFSREMLELWYRLHRLAGKVLTLGIKSLDPDCEDFNAMGQKVLAARDDYAAASKDAKETLFKRMESHDITPIAGVDFREYLSVFDRMVKHIKAIAQAEMQPYFLIKEKKLDRVTGDAPSVQLPDKVDPGEFIDRDQGSRQD